MIKEIQFQRSKQMMFAMDEQYQVIGQWPCKDDFVPGYNAAGDPRGSLPDGTYTSVWAEVTNGMEPLMATSILPAMTREGETFTEGVLDCLTLMQIIKGGYRHMAACECRTLTV